MCLGIPGRIVEIVDPDNRLAKVEISGVRRLVNIACITDDTSPIASCVGQWVLVHVGFAMSRIDEVEARNTLELLKALEDIDDRSTLLGEAGGA
ncbi:HypC/HybG/HupF family hydrogenase formation chaperone [Thiomonas sp. FB-Cd]|uniref:HypC/HybG/HupF family hydrogenase formation chaperone n=1 Tax=Thiomonas sp. FB-Cd TaxID=1158292 RepID=UPI0004DFBFCA|nr:HypC/HybG/HupF family hydrogenase formation chaperone [Thiomonas sp. FB-Cd]